MFDIHSLTPGCWLWSKEYNVKVTVTNINTDLKYIDLLYDNSYPDGVKNRIFYDKDDSVMEYLINEDDLIKLGFNKSVEYSEWKPEIPDLVEYRSPDHRLTIREDTMYMYGNRGDAHWCLHLDSEDFSTIAGADVNSFHEVQAICHAVGYTPEFEKEIA